MQGAIFTLSNKFGGLLPRPEPHMVGPNRAAALSNANLDTGSIRAQAGPGDAVYTGGAGTYRSIYKFGGSWVTDSNTVAWQYVEFQGRLIRAAASNSPQYLSGSSWYTLGITAPGSAPTLGTAAGGLTGTYYYYVTYFNAAGDESAPSPISAGVSPAGQAVALSNIPVSADAQVTGRRIYRTGGTLSTINLVATLNASDTTATDNTADGAVGAALTTQTYTPPGQLEGIFVVPHMSRLMGWIGSDLYWCEVDLVAAWPAANTQPFPDTIKGGASFSGSVVVLTTSQPIVVLGNSPAGTGFATYAVPAQQGCLERDTVVDMGHALFYLSNDGICAFAGRDVEVISKQALADSLLATPGAASPTNAKAVRYNERYILFFQSGTSFSSGGYVEWNPRVDGNWLTGTITATAVHYNRTDDVLYVAQGSNVVKPYEAGTTVAGSYTTGAWVEKSFSLLKHWTQLATDNTGTVAVSVVIDGVTVLSAATMAGGASTVTRTRRRLPAGCRGRSISITITWDAGWNGKLVEVLDNVARKAARL